MSALLNLIKISSAPIKTGILCVLQRNIRTAPALAMLNNQINTATSKKREQRYMEQDKVPADSELIYRSHMESYVSWSINVSSVTASVLTVIALYQYTSGLPILNSDLGPLIFDKNDVYYFALGFVLMNSFLRYVISKMPQRIYKRKGEYLAIFHPQLPGLRPHHEFKQGEVTKYEATLNPWNNATYKLGTKATIIFEDYFRTPSEFHEMRKKIRT